MDMRVYERIRCNKDRVLSVWLYSLYTALFKSAHGVIPAGILGVASFGIGLAIADGNDQ